MQQTNEQLITGCIKGDEKSQMQLYDRYCNAMFTIACRYLNNEEDAKDVMQEAFLKAFSKIDNYVPKATIGTWIKRIVINQCLDVLKKKQLHFEELNDAVHALENETDWQFDSHITKNEVLNSISRLTLKYRLVVQLYLIEGYDHVEISQILEIPVKTSRTHLRRGKEKLKELLKEKQYARKE